MTPLPLLATVNLFFRKFEISVTIIFWSMEGIISLTTCLNELTVGDFLTDCREWLTWLDKLKWLLTFRLTGHFVPTALLSTFIPFFLTSSPLSVIVLFQSCCSHAHVFGRTLVYEFLFSYSHTEWNLLLLKQTPLWHEATWDKPEASLNTEIKEAEEEELAVSGNDLKTLCLTYPKTQEEKGKGQGIWLKLYLARALLKAYDVKFTENSKNINF